MRFMITSARRRLLLISLPGSSFAYSGEGFCYLGRVIEHLTGVSLASLTQELVFKPLHMKESSLIWEEKYDGQAAERTVHPEGKETLKQVEQIVQAIL